MSYIKPMDFHHFGKISTCVFCHTHTHTYTLRGGKLNFENINKHQTLCLVAELWLGQTYYSGPSFALLHPTTWASLKIKIFKKNTSVAKIIIWCLVAELWLVSNRWGSFCANVQVFYLTWVV